MFCTYFVLIGFILTFFNKNMTVVLVLTIAFANILSVSTGVSREGMDVKEGADDTLEYSELDAEKTKDDAKASASASAKTDASASAKTDASASAKASAKTDAKGDKSKSQMVDDLKKDAEKLIDTQNKIIGGFEKIDPYMKQAEQLIQHIDTTAKKIESINKSKVEQFKG
jgi:preprotein translocase subunit SecF